MVAIPTAIPRIGDMPKGEPVPEGTYHLRIDNAKYKVSGKNSKNPGTPMMECEITVFGPPEQEQHVGRKVFENLMLAGPGLPRTRQMLEAAGKDEDFVLDDTDQLIGLEFAALVQVEPERTDPGTGQKYEARSRIKRYFSLR